MFPFQACKPSDLRWVCLDLPEIEKLKCWVHPRNFQKGATRPIRFENVKHLIIDIYDKSVVVKTPLEFKQLEELELSCYRSVLSRIDFARSNNLKKLKIHAQNEPSFSRSQLMKIIKQWPHLEEISLQLEQIDNAILLMDNLKHLKKLEITDVWTFDHEQNFAGLKSKIRNDWKIEQGNQSDYVITIVKANPENNNNS